MRIQQLLKKRRTNKKNKTFSNALKGQPIKKGTCTKVFTINPRKPNSAVRKVVKVLLSTRISVIASIPGEGHNLQEHSSVLVRAGQTKDLPGVQFKIIRGALDCAGVVNRKTSRSKYGAKKQLLFIFKINLKKFISK